MENNNTCELRGSRKTAICEELAKKKTPSIVLKQNGGYAFIILQIFLETQDLFKTGEYHSDIPQIDEYALNIQQRDALRPNKQVRAKEII